MQPFLVEGIFLVTYRLGELIGSGQFGDVYKGKWYSGGEEETVVAVKTLKENSNDGNKIKFLQEAAIMGQFKHPNIVCMYGIIADGEPVSHF